jgi:cellulose synthase/poly-beta-1,6-N-acetylglucosamine synthase-like glycosyltransferase
MGSFGLILGFTAGLLALVLCAAFVLPPPWSWAVGLVYIAYDTWLLSGMVVASRRALLRGLGRSQSSERSLTVAVLVAARNESSVLPRSIDALLLQSAPPQRLLVIDDGSTDGTDALLERRYGVRFAGGLGRSAAQPTLQVLRKAHSGKARSLNEALALVDEDIVVTLDADTYVQPGALAALRREFETHPELSAACGVLTPVCGPGPVARVFELYQRFEFLRGFLWRLAWMDRGTLILLSGAFAAFRRERLSEVGGFNPDSLVEDYELMFRLHRHASERGVPLQVHVVGEARATTDSPGAVRVFLRQRTRWFAGFLETLFRYRDMVGARRFGRLGRFHLRVKTVDTLLPIYGLAAVVVLFGLIASGRWPGGVVLAAIAAKLLFDLACHFYSMTLYQRWQGQRLTLAFSIRALLATLTEPLAFQLLRQLGAVLGWVAFLRGRIVWHPQRELAPAKAIQKLE